MPVGKAYDFVTIGMQVLYDRAGTIGGRLYMLYQH